MTKFSERFRAMADFILRIGPRGLPVLTNGDSYHSLALGLRPTNPKKNNHKNQSELGKNIVGNLLELKVFTSERSEAGKSAQELHQGGGLSFQTNQMVKQSKPIYAQSQY